MSIRSLFLLLSVMALIWLAPVRACAYDESFSDWKQGFASGALAAGVRQETLDAILPAIDKQDRVLDLDQTQPETHISFAAYLRHTVTDRRVRMARDLYRQHEKLLREIARRYHVQPRFVLALWGIETDFGQDTGGFSTLDALATLAWQGRRSDLFTDELIKAMLIVQTRHIDPQIMRGSWAGAMGQVQFMPSTYLKYAVDFDGDRRPDIWNSLPDVFASAANYLAHLGWQDTQTWGRRVRLPPNLAPDSVGLKSAKTLASWAALGVRAGNGADLPKRSDISASLVQPDGPGSTAWLVYDNYRVLMQWNRSTYFATAVGLFADRIGNR